MASLKIDVTKLLESPGYEERITGQVKLLPKKLGVQNIRFEKPIDFKLTLNNVNGRILVTGKLSAILILECSRCLENFLQPLELELREFFATKKAEEEFFEIERGSIDLEPPFYENLLLEVPIQPLCRKNCAGLCPLCGQNRNLRDCGHKVETGDQRMAVLKDFFKKSR